MISRLDQCYSGRERVLTATHQDLMIGRAKHGSQGYGEFPNILCTQGHQGLDWPSQDLKITKKTLQNYTVDIKL